MLSARTLIVAFALVASGAAHARGDDLADLESAAPTCDAARAHCFAIQLHVVVDGGAAVVTPDWFAAQLTAANLHFAAADIGFQLAGVEALPDTALHVITRADRNALAQGKGRSGGGVVHVFLVGSLDDVDVPGEARNGVAWRAPRDSRKYVIVSSQARPLTLAHELGHVFGLPHSTYDVSIMNKKPRDTPPVEERTFAEPELTKIRAHSKRLLQARTLVPVTVQRTGNDASSDARTPQ